MAKRPSKSDGAAVEGGDRGNVGPAGDGHPSRDERPDGWYLDDQGQLCFGQSCMVIKATAEGLAFELDSSTCDPETRERLVAAAMKGAKLKFL